MGVRGAAWGDVDGDGDLDLFICGLDCPNRLWINDGRGHFSDGAQLLPGWPTPDRA